MRRKRQGGNIGSWKKRSLRDRRGLGRKNKGCDISWDTRWNPGQDVGVGDLLSLAGNTVALYNGYSVPRILGVGNIK